VSLLIKPKIMNPEAPFNVYDPVAACNGILAGLVAITGCCHNTDVWACILIGGTGGAVYVFACKLEHKLRIDDPLEAS